MTIYHLEAKIVSRATGRSTVAAAAYMSCSKILNDYDGALRDFTRKQGLVWAQTFLPKNAPAEWANIAVLWNAVEEAEKTKDNRLAREFVVALPIEMDKAQWIELLTGFIQIQCVSDGMCADAAIQILNAQESHCKTELNTALEEYKTLCTPTPLTSNHKPSGPNACVNAKI